MPNQLMIYLFLIIILFVSGFWLVSLLLPRKFKNYYTVASVVLGSIWLTMISSWFSFIGLTMKQGAIYISILTLLLGGLALGSEIKKRTISDWKPDRYSLWVMSLGVISGLLLLSGTLIFKAFNPYTDGFTYVAIADYLLYNGYFAQADPNPYYPWLTQMRLYQEFDYRMGAQFLLSLITAILGRDLSIDVYMPLTALTQLLLVLVIWIFCRIGLNMPERASLFAGMFACLHMSIPMNAGLGGFLPQSVGLVFAVIVFTLIMQAFREEGKGLWSIVAIASLAVAALIMTYSEYVPFAGLSLLLLIIYRIITQRTWRDLMLASFILALAIILSNVGFINAISAIKSQMGVVVGWQIPYTLWQYVLLIFSMSPVHGVDGFFIQYPVVYIIVSVISLIILYVVVQYYLINKHWNKKELLLLSGSFLLMLVYFSLFVNDPWGNDKGHSWNIYKIVQYMFFIFPPIIGMAFYSFEEAKKLVFRVFAGAYTVILIGFVCYSTYINTEQMRSFTGNRENPIQEYYKLREAYKNEERPINLLIPTDQLKHRQMVAYFLKEHELVSDWTDDVYILGMLDEENRKPPFRPDGLTLRVDYTSEENIAGLVPVKDVSIVPGNGLYGSETDGTRSWQWASDDVTINAMNPLGINKAMEISFGVMLPPNVQQSEKLEIWYGSSLVDDFEIEPGVINDVSFVAGITPGLTDIVLKYSGEPVTVENDTRMLSFSLVDFQVESKQDIELLFTSGVYDMESGGDKNWYWSSGEASIQAFNYSGGLKPIEITFSVALPPDLTEKENIELWYKNQMVLEREIDPQQVNDFIVPVELIEGKSEFRIVYRGNVVKVPNDSRDLAFSIINFKYE